MDTARTEAELRTQARRRAYLCHPGAALAFLGYSRCAAIVLATNFLFLAVAIWFTLNPSVPLAATAGVLLVAAVAMWCAELIAIPRIEVRVGPGLLARLVVPLTTLVGIVSAALLVLAILNFSCPGRWNRTFWARACSEWVDATCSSSLTA